MRPTRAERPEVVIAAVDRDDRQTAALAKTIGRDARRSRHGAALQGWTVHVPSFFQPLYLFTALPNVGREPLPSAAGCVMGDGASSPIVPWRSEVRVVPSSQRFAKVVIKRYAGLVFRSRIAGPAPIRRRATRLRGRPPLRRKVLRPPLQNVVCTDHPRTIQCAAPPAAAPIPSARCRVGCTGALVLSSCNRAVFPPPPDVAFKLSFKPAGIKSPEGPRILGSLGWASFHICNASFGHVLSTPARVNA